MQSIDGWLDLCSGIGAGFPYAGIKLWGRAPDIFCEWDSYCRRILAARFPRIYKIDDIKKCNFNLSSKVELITASPPCQPFSVDGKRLGADDERDCFPAVLAAIRQLRPQFAIIENVTGLLTCSKQPGAEQLYFTEILEHLSESGYLCEWQCIGSSAFQAPWMRTRLIIIAIARSIEWRGEQPTPWENQIRDSIKSIGIDSRWGSCGPEFLEAGYNLPLGWTNSKENRTAIELAQVQAQPSLIDPRSELPAEMETTAIEGNRSEMPLTGESLLSDSNELIISLNLPQNIGALEKAELISMAIEQHQLILYH